MRATVIDKGRKNIPKNRTVSYLKLVHEIGKEKRINVEKEVELAKKIRVGDRDALNELVKANLRFVVSVANQYKLEYLLDSSDLISEGFYGLIKAAQRFDETRGCKFTSYAVWRIQAEILLSLINLDKFIRLPLNVSTKRSKARKVKENFFSKNGFYPSNEYTSNELEISEREMNLILWIPERILSTSEPCMVCLNSDTLDSTEFTPLDLFGSDEFPADQDLEKQSLKIEVERALNTLTYREKEVIKYFYGIDIDALTLEEIGERVGLTRDRVQQIKEKAIRRLKQSSRSKRLKEYLG